MRLLLKGAAVASALALAVVPMVSGASASPAPAAAATQAESSTAEASRAQAATAARAAWPRFGKCNDHPIERYKSQSQCVRLLKHLWNCEVIFSTHGITKRWKTVQATTYFGKRMKRNIVRLQATWNDEHPPARGILVTGKAGQRTWAILHRWWDPKDPKNCYGT